MNDNSNIVDDAAESIVHGTIGAGVPIITCVLAGGLIYGSFFLPEDAIPIEWWFYRALLAILIGYIVYNVVFVPMPAVLSHYVMRLELMARSEIDAKILQSWSSSIRSSLEDMGFEVDLDSDEDFIRATCRKNAHEISMFADRTANRVVRIGVSPTHLGALSFYGRIRGKTSSATREQVVDFTRAIINAIRNDPCSPEMQWRWSERDPHSGWRPPFNISVLTNPPA